MPSRSSRPPAKPNKSTRAAKKPGAKARKTPAGAGKVAAAKASPSRTGTTQARTSSAAAPKPGTTKGRTSSAVAPKPGTTQARTSSAVAPKPGTTKGRTSSAAPKKAPGKPAARASTSRSSPSDPARSPAVKVGPTPGSSEALEPADDSSPASSTSSGLTFPIEIDPDRIEHTLKKIGEEVSHWAKKGRYTKVRFKFRGKQLLPDLPLAAVVAAEGLTFYWGGILRALLVTVGANAVFGVELVNDSEKKVLAGKEKLLRGDLEEALVLFREAADMDRDNPHVHLNIGIGLKLRGDRVGAREALLKARQLDPTGPTGDEAEKILSTLPSQMTVTAVVQNGPPMNPDRPSGAV